MRERQHGSGVAEMLERLAQALAAQAGDADSNDVPVLDTIMTAALEKLASNLVAMVPTADCSMRRTTGGILSRLLDRSVESSIFVMARMEKPADFVIVRAGRSTLDWWVTATIGGSAVGPSSTNRAITVVEQRIGRIIIDLVLSSLASALSQLSIATSFHECRAVISADELPKMADDPSALSVLVGLSREEGGAEVEIIVPKRLAVDWCGRAAAHDQARESVAQGESDDVEWAGQLEAQVATTRVRLDAVLNHSSAEVGWIGSWAVGQTIPIGATTATPIVLESDGVPLLICRLGKFGGNLSLQVEAAADLENDGRRIELGLRECQQAVGAEQNDVNQNTRQERLNG